MVRGGGCGRGGQIKFIIITLLLCVYTGRCENGCRENRTSKTSENRGGGATYIVFVRVRTVRTSRVLAGGRGGRDLYSAVEPTRVTDDGRNCHDRII